MTTSSRPPWPEAQTSGTPFSGGESCPSAVTMRMRPGRSVTSILPSGRNASAQGWTRPLAMVCTSSWPADERTRLFAARAGGDQERRRQQDRRRQRRRSQGRQVFSSWSDRDADHRALLSAKDAKTRKNARNLAGNRHRHGDLDRQHRQRDDQAQRQRADRQRGGDGVGQSGRSNWCGAAVKARPRRATVSWS